MPMPEDYLTSGYDEDEEGRIIAQTHKQSKARRQARQLLDALASQYSVTATPSAPGFRSAYDQQLQNANAMGQDLGMMLRSFRK